MTSKCDGAVVVFGSTGYLGGLTAATLLAEAAGRLILPVRGGRSRDDVLRPIVAELEATGRPVRFADLDRVEVTALPEPTEIRALAAEYRRKGVGRIVHCAGSVDYFDREKLIAGNVELTEAITGLAGDVGVDRLVYVSTAFSCGFRPGRVAEVLHHEPEEDPTDYTWSKRQGEHVVARSGVPYLIVRPSIVVGDSRDGRYTGKRYGVYQLWEAAERLLCSRYLPVIHAVAPPMRLQLLHQDAFRAGFLASYRKLPADSIVHLVSNEDTLPTVRDLYDLWFRECSRPRSVHYYDSLDDVPMRDLDKPQRLWTQFTAVNLEIASRSWSFERTMLECLVAGGLEMADATLKTIAVCQRRFIESSERIGEFLRTYKGELEAA